MKVLWKLGKSAVRVATRRGGMRGSRRECMLYWRRVELGLGGGGGEIVRGGDCRLIMMASWSEKRRWEFWRTVQLETRCTSGKVRRT